MAPAIRDTGKSAPGMHFSKFKYRLQLYLMEVKTLKEKEENAKKEVQKLLEKQKADEARRTVEQQKLDAELQDAKKTCQEMQAQNKEFKREMEALVSSNKLLKEEVAALLHTRDAAFEELQTSKAELEQTLHTKMDELKVAVEKLDTQSALVEAIETEFINIQECLDETRQLATTRKEAVESLDKKVDELLGYEKFIEKIKKLEGEAKEQTFQIAAKDKEILGLKERLGGLEHLEEPSTPEKVACLANHGQTSAMNEDEQALILELKKIESSVQSEHTVCRQQQESVEQLQGELVKAEECRRKLDEALSEVRKHEKHLTAEKNALEKKLKAASQRLEIDHLDWQMREDMLQRKAMTLQEKCDQLERKVNQRTAREDKATITDFSVEVQQAATSTNDIVGFKESPPPEQAANKNSELNVSSFQGQKSSPVEDIQKQNVFSNGTAQGPNGLQSELNLASGINDETGVCLPVPSSEMSMLHLKAQTMQPGSISTHSGQQSQNHHQTRSDGQSIPHRSTIQAAGSTTLHGSDTAQAMPLSGIFAFACTNRKEAAGSPVPKRMRIEVSEEKQSSTLEAAPQPLIVNSSLDTSRAADPAQKPSTASDPAGQRVLDSRLQHDGSTRERKTFTFSTSPELHGGHNKLEGASLAQQAMNKEAHASFGLENWPPTPDKALAESMESMTPAAVPADGKQLQVKEAEMGAGHVDDNLIGEGAVFGVSVQNTDEGENFVMFAHGEPEASCKATQSAELAGLSRKGSVPENQKCLQESEVRHRASERPPQRPNPSLEMNLDSSKDQLSTDSNVQLQEKPVSGGLSEGHKPISVTPGTPVIMQKQVSSSKDREEAPAQGEGQMKYVATAEMRKYIVEGGPFKQPQTSTIGVRKTSFAPIEKSVKKQSASQVGGITEDQIDREQEGLDSLAVINVADSGQGREMAGQARESKKNASPVPLVPEASKPDAMPVPGEPPQIQASVTKEAEALSPTPIGRPQPPPKTNAEKVASDSRPQQLSDCSGANPTGGILRTGEAALPEKVQWESIFQADTEVEATLPQPQLKVHTNPNAAQQSPRHEGAVKESTRVNMAAKHPSEDKLLDGKPREEKVAREKGVSQTSGKLKLDLAKQVPDHRESNQAGGEPGKCRHGRDVSIVEAKSGTMHTSEGKISTGESKSTELAGKSSDGISPVGRQGDGPQSPPPRQSQKETFKPKVLGCSLPTPLVDQQTDQLVEALSVPVQPAHDTAVTQGSQKAIGKEGGAFNCVSSPVAALIHPDHMHNLNEAGAHGCTHDAGHLSHPSSESLHTSKPGPRHIHGDVSESHVELPLSQRAEQPSQDLQSSQLSPRPDAPTASQKGNPCSLNSQPLHYSPALDPNTNKVIQELSSFAKMLASYSGSPLTKPSSTHQNLLSQKSPSLSQGANLESTTVGMESLLPPLGLYVPGALPCKLSFSSSSLLSLPNTPKGDSHSPKETSQSFTLDLSPPSSREGKQAAKEGLACSCGAQLGEDTVKCLECKRSFHTACLPPEDDVCGKNQYSEKFRCTKCKERPRKRRRRLMTVAEKQKR